MGNIKPSLRGRSDLGRTVWANCTAARGHGDFCNNEVPEGAPVSMCGKHLIAAYRFCEEALGEAERSERFQRAVDLDKRRYGATGNSVVYYMLFGRTVKIGTTADLRTRIRQLRPDRVLATEPGYFELERQRHQQFDYLRVERASAGGRRNEYFRATAELLRFISSLPGSEVPDVPRRPRRSAAGRRATLLAAEQDGGQLSMLADG